MKCSCCGKEIKPFDNGSIHYEYKNVHVCSLCSFDYVKNMEVWDSSINSSNASPANDNASEMNCQPIIYTEVNN